MKLFLLREAHSRANPLGVFAGVMFILAASAVAESVPEFSLTDLRGKVFELNRATDAEQLAILALRSGDPLNEALIEEAQRLWPPFKRDRQVVFLITASPTQPRDALLPVFESILGSYAVLHDPAGIIAASLGLKHTGDWLEMKMPTRELTGMPNSLLPADNKAGALSETSPETDYSTVIAPILQRRCVKCHQEGDNGPFSMDSYQRVKGWAPMIGEVVRTRRMPPWGADAEYGDFQDDLSLDVMEKRNLLAWIEAGAPRGEGEDPLDGVVVDEASGDWPLGPPDQILRLPEMQVIPAEGRIKYRYFDIGLAPSEEDRWLRATHVRPTHPGVVHHALVFVRKVGERIDPQGEFMTSFLPGMGPQIYPEGSGKRIPPKAELIIQMHYTTMGKAAHDQTEVGLYFLPEAPKRELRRMVALRREFEVPAMAEDYAISTTLEINEARDIFAFHPHMHYRGKWMRYEAKFPDGTEEILLNVPRYDFYWQHTYTLETPRRLPRGTVLKVTGAFDNSFDNPLNPNPMATLHWGEESDQEMFVGAMTYAVAE